MTSPVRWVETVQKMAVNGVDTIVELGSAKVLAGLVRRIDKGLRAYSVEDPCAAIGSTAAEGSANRARHEERQHERVATELLTRS
jgi:[acyl-carrier-protein] S-malonyltransferase